MQHRVIAVVAATAFVLVSCDDGVPDLDTLPAVGNIDAIIERSGSDAELDECPMGDVGPLLDTTFDLLDDDIVRSALAGAPATSTYDSRTEQGAFVTCDLIGDDGTVGFYVVDAPDDIAVFTDGFIGMPLDGVTIDIDESRLFRGGRFHHVCVNDTVDPGLSFCEVDWIDDNVMVGVFLAGNEAQVVDVDDLEERFQYVLPTLIERLSDT